MTFGCNFYPSITGNSCKISMAASYALVAGPFNLLPVKRRKKQLWSSRQAILVEFSKG